MARHLSVGHTLGLGLAIISDKEETLSYYIGTKDPRAYGTTSSYCRGAWHSNRLWWKKGTHDVNVSDKI